MKYSAYLIVLIAGLMCLPALAGTKLIASGHSDYPPFMYREGDRIVGVGTDLVTLIFAELGIEVESPYVGSWERVLRKLQKGEIDAIVGAYKTPERELYLDFPEQNYLEEPVVVFVHKNRPFEFHRWQDLTDKMGGTVIGESWGDKFDEFARNHLNLQRLVHIGYSFKMMDRNRLDYAIYALYPGKINLIELGLQDNIKALPTLVSAPKAYQAFSKKSPFVKYLDYYSKRIKQLREDGTVQRLIDKHMARWETRTAKIQNQAPIELGYNTDKKAKATKKPPEQQPL